MEQDTNTVIIVAQAMQLQRHKQLMAELSDCPVFTAADWSGLHSAVRLCFTVGG